VLWEVIIVDNNSKDSTPAVVEEAKKQFPDAVEFRYVFEEKQGLAHARNRGIEEAQGDVLLFTDDDVCPESDWLKEILDGMSRYECDACGGYIAPIWEADPPPWLTDRFHGFLAIRMDESGPKEVAAGSELPFGANMAFRRSVFERVGQFDTTRGRTGKTLASGEDGELFERILGAGLHVMYFPQARVNHRIEAERVRRSYFRRWRYQNSRNLAQSKGFPGKRRFMGIPLYMFPQLMRAMMRAVAARIQAPADEAFFREILVWHFLGLMAGLWRADTRSQEGSD